LRAPRPGRPLLRLPRPPLLHRVRVSTIAILCRDRRPPWGRQCVPVGPELLHLHSQRG
jgi:hypothetical protein